jgi:hypothetical protein
VIYMPLAIDIVNERSREARQHALIAAAGRIEFSGPSGSPQRPSRARALVARPVRALSDASHALSEAACSAATRIEGAAR